MSKYEPVTATDRDGATWTETYLICPDCADGDVWSKDDKNHLCLSCGHQFEYVNHGDLGAVEHAAIKKALYGGKRG